MNEIQKVKKLLNTQFHMKDMGALGYFLDLEVSRTDQGISVSQKKYTLDFLMESGLQDTKVLKLSLDQHVKLTHDSGYLLQEQEKYRRIIGKLIYLTFTRSDISFSGQLLS